MQYSKQHVAVYQYGKNPDTVDRHKEKERESSGINRKTLRSIIKNEQNIQAVSHTWDPVLTRGKFFEQSVKRFQ